MDNENRPPKWDILTAAQQLVSHAEYEIIGGIGTVQTDWDAWYARTDKEEGFEKYSTVNNAVDMLTMVEGAIDWMEHSGSYIRYATANLYGDEEQNPTWTLSGPVGRKPYVPSQREG